MSRRHVDPERVPGVADTLLLALSADASDCCVNPLTDGVTGGRSRRVLARATGAFSGWADGIEVDTGSDHVVATTLFREVRRNR